MRPAVQAPGWAVEAARRSAGSEMQAGNGVRCVQEDAELAEYSFELFCPTTGVVIADINVTEVGSHLIERR